MNLFRDTFKEQVAHYQDLKDISLQIRGYGNECSAFLLLSGYNQFVFWDSKRNP